MYFNIAKKKYFNVCKLNCKMTTKLIFSFFTKQLSNFLSIVFGLLTPLTVWLYSFQCIRAADFDRLLWFFYFFLSFSVIQFSCGERVRCLQKINVCFSKKRHKTVKVHYFLMEIHKKSKKSRIFLLIFVIFKISERLVWSCLILTPP